MFFPNFDKVFRYLSSIKISLDIEWYIMMSFRFSFSEIPFLSLIMYWKTLWVIYLSEKEYFFKKSSRYEYDGRKIRPMQFISEISSWTSSGFTILPSCNWTSYPFYRGLYWKIWRPLIYSAFSKLNGLFIFGSIINEKAF